MEIVIFALGLLTLIFVLIAVSVPLSKRIGLPLPVFLAAAGLAYGGVLAALGLSLEGSALDAYDLWFLEQLALDGGVLLYLFLPPLLFEMSLAVDVRRMLDEMTVVISMAVFAVAAATLAVGLSVWSASGLGLIACLMLGAAVATTDPAAVVATFREIGAPKRLLVVLEGESLLNDAAAIAIFALLLSLAGAGGEAGPGAVVFGFLYSFIGGAATGLILSYLASRIYPFLGASAHAETSMTVALAYGAYIAAEQIFTASGVVAVVCAGLATGSVGFVRMGPRNWRGVRDVWAQIGFWSSALILLIISSLTPALLNKLSWSQAALAGVVYLSAFGARAAMLAGVLPALERLRLSAPIDPGQRALVLWGGVRGAVTLVLALSLTEISAIGEDAAVVGALAALFTLITLFLNAATLTAASRALGLDRLSATDQALREKIASGAIEQVRGHIREIAEDRRFGVEALEAAEAALTRHRTDAEAEALAQAGGLRIPFGEKLRLGLAILSGQEQQLIQRAFEDGAIGPRATNRLRLAADRLADAVRVTGRDGYEAAAEAALRPRGADELALLAYRFGFDGPLRQAIELRLTTLLESERMLRDLDRFAEAALPQMIGEDAAANLRGALRNRLASAEAEAASLARQYPTYAAALERLLIMRAAIRREQAEYERLAQDGVVGPELMQDLMRDLSRRMSAIDRPPRLDLTLSPMSLVEKTPLFSDLDPERRKLIARRLKVVVARPGETVLAAGSRRSDLFLVVSGALVERDGDRETSLSNGDLFGERGFLQPGRRRKSAVVSLGYSRLLSLSARDFARIGSADDRLGAQLRERIAQIGARRRRDAGAAAE